MKMRKNVENYRKTGMKRALETIFISEEEFRRYGNLNFHSYKCCNSIRIEFNEREIEIF